VESKTRYKNPIARAKKSISGLAFGNESELLTSITRGKEVSVWRYLEKKWHCSFQGHKNEGSALPSRQVMNSWPAAIAMAKSSVGDYRANVVLPR